MIIGCLALGLSAAILSATLALMSGFGLMAALGIYVLMGSVTTVAVACAGPWHRRRGRVPEMLAAKA